MIFLLSVVDSSVGLYYKLPYHTVFGNENRYQILRTDQEKIVAYAETQKEAEDYCDSHNDTKDFEIKAKDFILRLVLKGGAIVSSNDCSTMEIADARASDRWFQINSFGFVIRSREWLDHMVERDMKIGLVPTRT